MAKSWDTQGDWDGGRSKTNFRHEALSNTDHGDAGLLAMGQSFQPPDLTQNLVLWQPLHDDICNDFSGNGYHGSVNGDPKQAAARAGLQGTSFDGDDDYLSYSSAPAVPASGSQPFSISFWLYLGTSHSSNGPVIFDLRHNYDWFIRYNDGGNNKLKLHNYDGASGDGIYSSTSPSTGVWQHWTVRYNGDGTGEWFLNGQQDASDTIQTDVATKSTGMYLAGDEAQTNMTDAVFFDLRMYNAAVSDSKAAAISALGTGDYAMPPTDGISKYTFDGTLTDAWGTNDGTASGGFGYSTDAIRNRSGSFNGTDASVDITGIPSLSAFTITWWMKSNDTTTDYLTPIWLRENNGLIGRNDAANGTFEWVHDDGSTTHYMTAAQESSVWNFYGVTWNGSSSTLYRNGIPVDRIQVSTMASAAQGDALGADIANNRRYYNGLLDEVQMYDYAISREDMYKNFLDGTRGRDMRDMVVRA